MKIFVAILDIVILLICISMISQGNVLGGIAFFIGTILVEAYIATKFM